MSQPTTIVAAVVTRVYDAHLSKIVKQCGTAFRYESHLATPQGISLRVTCLCPDGHGVNHLPWNGWLDAGRGRFDLADIEAPARTVFLSTEIPTEVPEDLREDGPFLPQQVTLAA